jgi:short-subunit dehydrogenase
VSPRSILITGASSGIGAALAMQYAAAGIALALGGRDGARLERVAAGARAKGAAVVTRIADVTDAAAMAAWIAETDRADPLDLVIANAGISAGTGGTSEPAEQAARIFAINVDGVRHTVLPAIAAMQARGRGQIAIMSSLSGFRGMPGAPAYSASKAAVRVWGEALRAGLAHHGIGLSVICPGYVRSAITAANRFPMPLLMDADRAARIIRRGLDRNRARIAFPWPLYWIVWLLQAVPPGWTDGLVARLPAKGRDRAA